MMTAIVATVRSTCLRRKVGAVITRSRHIISTGYNGSPSGVRHCSETGCMRSILGIPSGERHELCRGSHAELNAIAQAARMGPATAEATIYCTTEPCAFCTKAILNAGISRIVFLHPYPDPMARELREEGGVEVVQLPPESLAAIKAQLALLASDE
jgi:dCMP deaminase